MDGSMYGSYYEGKDLIDKHRDAQLETHTRSKRASE
jgi:hypothetical protein